MGTITPNFREGSLLLQEHSGKLVRLAWKKEHSGEDYDRRRQLPPGRYVVKNYTIVQRDEKGNLWMLSGTGKKIRAVNVERGKSTRVNLHEAVFLKLIIRPGDMKTLVGAAVQGEHHSGLTIYKGTKRITLRYRVTGPDGKTLASGPMKYG